MKKKIILCIVVTTIIISTIVGVIIWNNRVVSIINIDINPSLEIRLKSNETVKEIIALNDDAKKIIKNIKGKSFEDAISVMTNNLMNNGYIEDRSVFIIIYSSGKINNDLVSKKIKKVLNKKDISSEIIEINNITNEDKELAKKYNISPSKAAYVNKISNEKGISIDNLINKEIKELKETSETGAFCEEGYYLSGDWCYKEVRIENAKTGKVCPEGYFEHDGICYEETALIESDNYVCMNDYKLINNKCIREETYDALGKCNSGIYSDGYCIIKEYIGMAEEYCRITPSSDILIDHKCYGPKPTINGGCLDNDVLMDAGCVDMNSYYESDWICPDGSFLTNPDGSLQNEEKKCYKESRINPDSYYCEDNGKLDGTKCKITKKVESQKERLCPSGYTIINNEKCINRDKTIEKVDGYVCEGDNTRLKDNTCIIYDVVESKRY